MIIITSGSGALGRTVVEKLLARVPAEQIGVSVRDPEKVREFSEQGVRVRHGDYNDAESLTRAFEGATRVLVVSANSTGETAERQNRTAIEAAKAAGAHRIVYTSHMGAIASSAFSPMVVHAASEAVLQNCGVSFIALRNGFYADSAALFLGNAVETGELSGPEDGPIAYTAHADLAEAAAFYLTGDEAGGATPPLTAEAAFDMAGLATLASKITGRPIRRVVVPEAEHKANLRAKGVPNERVEMMLGLFAASRRGDFARTGPVLGQILGQSPTPLRNVLETTLSPKK